MTLADDEHRSLSAHSFVFFLVTLLLITFCLAVLSSRSETLILFFYFSKEALYIDFHN